MQTFRPLVQDCVPERLLSTTRLCYIPTAAWTYSETSEKGHGEQRRRWRYEAKQKIQMLAAELGTSGSTVVLELDSPNQSTASIQEALSNADILYVDGGNTFYLQHTLIKTNFWSVALPLIETNKLLYIGASAGGIVAGNRIETALWKGWDKPHPPGMGMDDWQWAEGNRMEGSGLVDFSLFMHFVPEMHTDLVQKRGAGCRVHCIADNCAVAVGMDPGPALVELSADGVRRPLTVSCLPSV